MIPIPATPETDFKETEIGPIPADWEVVPLRLLGSRFFGGGTPSTAREDYWSGDIPWTTSAHIGEDLYLESIAGHISQIGLRESTTNLVPSGNLLIGTRVGVGKVAINPFDVAVSQDLTAMLVRHDLCDIGFLAYSIRSELAQRQILLASRGTTIKGIPREDLTRVLIPLPPLLEQRRIAAVLNTLQEEIAAQDDILTAARTFKRSLMQRLFTYGPGETPAPTRLTSFGEVPAHWDIGHLGDCAVVQTGIAKGRTFASGENTIVVPYLRVANVQDGHLDLSEIKYIEIRRIELERFRVHVGDVLMTEGGDEDKLGRGFVWRGEIEQCVHQNHVFAVRVNNEFLLPDFLTYLGQSSYGKSYFLAVAHRTTNLASINSTKLKAFPVLLAPIEEQVQIVGMLQSADDTLAVEEDRKAALQEAYRTLLHQLMSGQIRLLSDDGLPL